jgi:hypothetical protein
MWNDAPSRACPSSTSCAVSCATSPARSTTASQASHPALPPLAQTRSHQPPQQHGHDGAEHAACFAHVPPRRSANRAGYWSWLRVVLVGVAVAHRRLGPAPRPPPRRWTGRCRLRWSGCLESRIWRGRLVSQADLYPGVPSRSLLRARRWACPLCTSLTHSQPGLADGPIRGSLGSWPSRKACTYARSSSIRART